jgi:hypothetical protein
MLCLCVLAGCSPSAVEVGGRATLDGEPLADALVTFQSNQGERVYAYGRSDANGEYSLKQTETQSGLPAGEYTIRVTTFLGPVEGSGSDEPRSPERVPACYNSESTLTATVTAEQTRWNLPLTSDCTGQAEAAAASN